MILSFLLHINSSRVIPAELRMQLQRFKLLFVSAVLIAAFVLSACDKIPSGVVDSKIVDYSMVKIELPVSVTYSKADSLVTTSLWIANNESVSGVWCKISSLDGQIIISSGLTLEYAYDMLSYSWQRDLKVYSAKFSMSHLNPNGKYLIEYFVKDNINLPPNNSTKVGSALFTYDNNQNNLPPVISNLSVPSTISRGNNFSFFLKAEDPNGASDIQSVFYKLYRPDGTLVVNSQGISEFPLYDDGNSSVHGDQTAGDGIYSAMLNFPATQPTGVWKFEFRAKDRGGMLSNLITQNLTVN